MPIKSHKIKFSLENLQNHALGLDLYLNNTCLFRKSFTKPVKEQFLAFDYDYKVGINSLKLIFHGKQDQPHKLLKVHSILVGQEHVNVYRGYYKPFNNDFWQLLDAKEKEHMIRKCGMHGGNFGWYGEVEFEYFTYTHMHQTKQQNNFFVMQRIAL